MTPERWQQVKELLGTALELDPAKRPGYLDQACGNDATLRSDLERLLVAEQKAGPEFLSDPVILQELTLELPPRPHAWVGRRLGAYEIVEEIGTGGMGEVYRAVRADDEYRKEAAIKLVRSGQDSSFVLSRFKNERQILASLDHPNIARLLDGGTTEQGVPYFVMELIEGERINKYCDARKLPTTDRLKLFLQVCSAVQYAHQHLVIHRDIKPGNILVTAEGVPKLLDFGIAKILESSEAADQPGQTISLIRLLTPEYASPEQVKGEPVTTASDVYSLGVVLYELLTGRTPYNVSTRTPHDISRAVCEFEPEKPSTAVRRKQPPAGNGESKGTDDSALSAVQEGSPEKLSKRLNGDLDNIVLMALRKEPQRRYASVEQFAQDIRRHLEHLPVIARKDTAAYRASKFISRHKLGVGATTLATILLISALAVAVHQARIARANALRAERRFNDLRRLANSLVFDLHDAVQDLPGSTTARHLIVTNAIEYLDRLSADAGDDPSLKLELAGAYLKLGTIQGNATADARAARQSYLKAVSIFESLLTRRPTDSAIQRQLASAYGHVGDVTNDPASLEYYKKSLDLRERLSSQAPNDAELAGELAQSYHGVASVMITSRNFQAAKEASQKSLAAAQRYYDANPHGEDETVTLTISYTRLGNSLEMLEEYDAALAAHTRALELDRQLALAHPDIPNLQRDVAIDFGQLGRLKMSRKDKSKDAPSALADFRRAIAIYVKITLADPADKRTVYLLAHAHEDAGSALLEEKKYDSALAEYRTALGVCRCASGWDAKNDRPARLAGNIYKLMGDTYEALASSAKKSPSAGFLPSACSNYQNSIAAFDFLQSIASATAADREIQHDASLRWAQCSAVTR